MNKELLLGDLQRIADVLLIHGSLIESAGLIQRKMAVAIFSITMKS
ncbi:MAG: hypothetical protein SOR57_04870 [Parabacteroides sp.]|nr:hypothetical protein [Parabacteroides sp.]